VTLKLGLTGLQLSSSFFGGTALPFVVIEKSVEVDGAADRFSEVYKSEMAEPKDPSFKAVTFKTSRLCHSNLNAPIKFKLYTNKDSKPLGEVTISVSELTDKRELSIVDIET